MPRSAYTSNTITGVEPLLQSLTETRKTAVGTDDQEFMHGVVCVAVPVIDDNGRCFGGIAVSAPEARMTLSEMLTYVPQMENAAASLASSYQRNSNA